MMPDYFAEYIVKREELAICENELQTLLDILFSSIHTETYIDPHGVMAFLKARYPGRWGRKMDEIYAQGD